MGRKACFIFNASNWGGCWTLVQSPTYPTDNQWARAFIGKGRGRHVLTETAQSTLKLVMWQFAQCHLNCFKYS